ncbi:MAG: flagellar basal body rod protein FlgB [Thermodesulfobacteriota bacterium]
MGEGLFTHTMQVLKRSLDVRLLKHGLTTSNVANAEVPGFKPKDISFKDAMRTAVEGGELQLVRTSRCHLPVGDDDNNLSARIVESPYQGVDIDREMAGLAENNLMYQASIQLLAKKFEGIKTAIIEGGK